MSFISAERFSNDGCSRWMFLLSSTSVLIAKVYKRDHDDRFAYVYDIGEESMTLEQVDLAEKVIGVQKLSFAEKKQLLMTLPSREISVIKGPKHQDMLIFRALS